MRGLCSTRRGVAPVISTILMVAVAVILSATIATFVLDVGEDVSNPGPNIAESQGAFVGGTGNDQQIVRLTHVAGDAVDVSELEIVVDPTDGDGCDVPGRIINLPADGILNFDDPPESLTSENLQRGSNSPISQRAASDLGVLHENNENTFKAGSYIEFRIKAGSNSPGCALSPADEVTIDVVHTPSNSILLSTTVSPNE